MSFQTVEPARSSAYDRAMAVNLWSDESKTFEYVNDGPLTADEIAEVRELWRRATPEQRVQLMAHAEALFARQNGEQPHQARAGGQRSSRHARPEDGRGCQ